MLGHRRIFKQRLFPGVVALVVVTGCLVGAPAIAAAGPVTITVVAEAGADQGGGFVYATAALAGGDDPTGTVTFRLFGPADHTCERPARFTSTNPVTGAGDPKRATSDRYALPQQGVYHFVATYSGDARNAPAGPSACDAVNAAIGFAVSGFSFSAQASPSVVLGGTLSDTAAISISSYPTGTITFDLFGPGAPTCTGAPVFTSSVPVDGDGSYTSDPFLPTAIGAYRWVARYSGDADDPSIATGCADPAQQVEVRAADPPSASTQCTVPARPLGRLAALLRDVFSNPFAALLGRLSGLTACGPG